jgi:hypothetical protein
MQSLDSQRGSPQCAMCQRLDCSIEQQSNKFGTVTHPMGQRSGDAVPSSTSFVSWKPAAPMEQSADELDPVPAVVMASAHFTQERPASSTTSGSTQQSMKEIHRMHCCSEAADQVHASSAQASTQCGCSVQEYCNNC